jgi:hypothetical protein
MKAISDLDGELDNLICDCVFDLEKQNGSTEQILRDFQRCSVRVAVDEFKKVTMKALNSALGTPDAGEGT